MVVHRTCSFCAGEIEPGTGQLFVKRDGSLYSFCSSSCRKQQMTLGRVGHRLRWTRAHELKRLAEQRRPGGGAEAPPKPAVEAGGESAAPEKGATRRRGARKSASAKVPAKSAARPAPVPSESGAKSPAKPRPKKAAAPSEPK